MQWIILGVPKSRPGGSKPPSTSPEFSLQLTQRRLELPTARQNLNFKTMTTFVHQTEQLQMLRSTMQVMHSELAIWPLQPFVFSLKAESLQQCVGLMRHKDTAYL